jgi:excisionase family DNA binding protein
MHRKAEALLLRVEQAAQLAAISRTHAYSLLARGEWPSVHLGRSRRIPRAWLERWIDRQVAHWEQVRGRER